MKTCYLVYGAGAALLLLAGCSTAPQSQSDRHMLTKETDLTVEKFKAADPYLIRFLDQARGYAVFPSIMKGGFGVGGTYGRGVLYEKTVIGANAVGYIDTKHASIGLRKEDRRSAKSLSSKTGRLSTI